MKKFWIVQIFLITLLLASVLGIISEISLRNLNMLFAIITLLFIIFIGIFFDVIGIAVAAANEAPFHSMATRKIKAASKAVLIVKKASIVSNFCNDVIGDIAGIISGAAVGIIILTLTKYDVTFLNVSMLSVSLAGLTAAITVSGKAVGKHIAMTHWKTIVYRFAIVIDFLERTFRIRII